MKKVNWTVVLAGIAVGIAAVALTALGNPANMGFCIACFLRDIAGGMKFHSAGVVQYIRPEIAGLVLGAFAMSLITKEFRAKSGASPVTRFVLGVVIMIGALAFLGCPLRMIIRLGGGDLNALVGLAGFAAGIGVGVVFIKKGFALKRNYSMGGVEGYILPAFMAVLLLLAVLVPALFASSESGPGSMHAPIIASFAIALVCGALAQRARLCTAGGIRDTILFGDLKLLWGFLAIFAVVLAGNLFLGKFKLGFTGQPVAHNDHIWNFVGMFVVGWASALAGGCPLRQLILAGEGNGDSAITVFGMIAGAAISHNFGLAGTAKLVADGGGVGLNGRIALIACIAVCLIISLVNLPKAQKN
ncbi:MAG: YedE family putative selenium transporter [Clostridia bacterium]|nr:YedE family putative selenium transporter [Clostridia bacterium]